MSKVLISIGCDDYDDPGLGKLNGAENDAQAIFQALISDQLVQLDQQRSKLLLSPTLSEIRAAISEALFVDDQIDCFTLFYAGHGGVKDGAYFLTCRDTKIEQMSLTALSTSNLFSFVNEAKCGHTNIIMDSCNSGGIVHDIGALLKPDVVGKANALSVSILAAAASDQYAEETAGQGYCTKAVLSCISGELTVPSTRPTLDLIDIGQVVAPSVPEVAQQNPEYWGISLKGHVPLCCNPAYSGQTSVYMPTSFDTELPQHLKELLAQKAERIWAQYFTINENFEINDFVIALRQCVEVLQGHPTLAADFVIGITTSFRQKIASQHTGFEEAEILGAGIPCILNFAQTEEAVGSIIKAQSREIVFAVKKGVSDLVCQMREHDYFLLSDGTADFYYLPLRISKILGWIGASAIIAKILDVENAHTEVEKLLQMLINDYSRSVFSVSDAQTPYFACFVSVADELQCTEQAEVLTSLMFSSFLEIKGRVTSVDAKPDQILKYILSTDGNQCEELDADTFAQPCELLPLFFILYKKFELSEELDRCLSLMDWQHGNIFIPDHLASFGEHTIRDGQNYTFQIGNGVWTSSDFDQRWKEILLHFAKVKGLNVETLSLGAIISSLIIPDRVPWFLFKDG